MNAWIARYAFALRRARWRASSPTMPPSPEVSRSAASPYRVSGPSAASAAGVSIAPPLSSRSRVSCLASSTLGWSNGSMPSTIPATAVANSQRQASAPRSIGSLKVMRMTGWPAASRAVGERVASAVVRAGQVEADEDAVRAVVGDVAERLEVDRDDPDAALAGALGDQLLQPRPEAADLVVGQERQLVAPVGGQRADGDAERDARVRLGVRLAAGAEHRDRGGQQRVEVQADQRRRHEPDIGQRRVPPADVGRIEEDLAEVVVVLDRVEALARVRDGGEERAGTVVDVVPHGVEGVLDALPLVGEEGVRLGRRAGLAGDDRHRPQRVEVVRGSPRRRPDRSSRGCAARGSRPGCRRCDGGCPGPGCCRPSRRRSRSCSPRRRRRRRSPRGRRCAR